MKLLQPVHMIKAGVLRACFLPSSPRPQSDAPNIRQCLARLVCVFLLAAPASAQQLKSLYEPQVFEGMPVRVMKPLNFDESEKYPVIVSLHGAGGRGTNNDKQLKDWNRQLAEPSRRTDFPCYVVAPQANELWNVDHLNRTKALIETLPAVDRDRIYIMGHSMGGHGTYIFIQLDNDYFAAAAPSAGSGLKRTADFINAKKIKDVPVWAFHGDKDRTCPYERDRKVFEEVKALSGNMKLTTWQGDNHGVSGKMIPGAHNGKTEFTSNRCDTEPDFMTWMFSQSRALNEIDDYAREINVLKERVRESSDGRQLRREVEYLTKTIDNLRELKAIRGRLLALPATQTGRRGKLRAIEEQLVAQLEADEEFIKMLSSLSDASSDEAEDLITELGEFREELEKLRRKLPDSSMAFHDRRDIPKASERNRALSVADGGSADTLRSGEYFITQTWTQEQNYRRPYFVHVPETSVDGSTEFPVFIFLHGNGGNAKKAMPGWLRNRRKLSARYIMVFAQGYRDSWNIVSERSKADDVGFIESIVKELARHTNVVANDFTIMGNSNGAALVNQMAIESGLPHVRNYISGVSPLNVWQHDGKHFKVKGKDNNYRQTATPAIGKRLLNISGTEDRLVPYAGGPSPVIPAKDGKLAFVHAEQSTFLWAKAMGYLGERINEPTSTRGNVDFFRYLDGNVVHCRVNNAGHGATHEISEETLLTFLQGKPERPAPNVRNAARAAVETDPPGFPPTAFEYAKMVEPALGVPPRIKLDEAIEIPLYVDGQQAWGNLGRQCDNPTFLGKDTVSGSRLQRYEGTTADGKSLSDVVWVAFGRNSSRNHEHVIGSVQMIGYNRKSGATAFFESSDHIEPWVTLEKETLRMQGTMPWIDDPEEFNRAFRTPGKVQCVECHQSDPFVTNSFINAAKIPGTDESVVPLLDRNSPYYVIGGENWDMRTIHIKGNACFECHRVGMGTMTLFMKNGWQPNDHMPPHNPGSLSDDLRELLEAWARGPDSFAGAEWIIPPAHGNGSRIAEKNYPYQASYNVPIAADAKLQLGADLEKFGAALKQKVQDGELTEEEAVKLYFKAAGKRDGTSSP